MSNEGKRILEKMFSYVILFMYIYYSGGINLPAHKIYFS